MSATGWRALALRGGCPLRVAESVKIQLAKSAVAQRIEESGKRS